MEHKFIIQEYAEGWNKQEDMEIMYTCTTFQAIREWLQEYFNIEDYYNAVYITDATTGKAGYVGRRYTINCGEKLEDFFGE